MKKSVQSMPHIASSPRATALVVAIERKYLQIVTLQTLAIMMPPSFEEQWPFPISSDGRLLTTESAQGRLFLWNFAEAREELKKQNLEWEGLDGFRPDTIPVIPPKPR